MNVNGANDNKPLPLEERSWLQAPDRVWSFRPHLNTVAYHISAEIRVPVFAHFNTKGNRVQLRLDDDRILADVEFQPSLEWLHRVVVHLLDEVTDTVMELFRTLFYHLSSKDIHFVPA